jgi:hypothetical protein
MYSRSQNAPSPIDEEEMLLNYESILTVGGSLLPSNTEAKELLIEDYLDTLEDELQKLEDEMEDLDSTYCLKEFALC